MTKKKHSLVSKGPGNDHFTHPGKGRVSIVQPVFLGGWGSNITNCPGMTDGMGSPPPPPNPGP